MITANLSEVTDSVIHLIRQNHAALGLHAGYKEPNQYGVFFGSGEGGYAPLPVIIVEPGGKRKTYAGSSFRTDNMFGLFIVILHCNLSDARSTVRRECLEKAETLEGILEEDVQRDGLLIQSLVSSIQPGEYFPGAGQRLYTHKLDWWGMSKTRL